MSHSERERPPAGKKPRQGRRRPRQNKRHQGDTPEARAAHIIRDLRTLAHQIGKRQPGQSGVMPSEISLALELALAHEAGDDEAAKALVTALDTQIHTARQAQAPFPVGRVPCFRSGHAEGPQSAPPTPTSVFAGHAATGKPTWVEFTSLCLERREPRVSALYRDPPSVIGVVQLADEMGEELLPEFNAQAAGFRILGQVAVGLVPGVALGGLGDVGRVAFALQAISVPTSGGDRLYINPIGIEERAVQEAAHGGSDRAEGLLKALKATRRRLRSLKRRQIARRDKSPLDVTPVLHRAKVELERALSPDRRRTQHAQDRHQSGERPTLSAVGDATSAPLEKLMEDAQRHTIVVLGPRGRAHIFSKEGRHVTSLKLEPGELERKTIRRRWRPLSAQQARQFRARLSERSRRNADG